MTRRYYHPELPSAGGLIQLTDDEAQHAIRVMRVKAGDQITLFDGRGNQAEAEIISVNRRECHCCSEPTVAIDRESSLKLHLGIALPKPDRARDLIERLTELGVHSVTPLVAARTQRSPSTSLIDKLRRAVIEASKQCGRNQLMKIHEPQSFSEIMVGGEPITNRWIAHPSGHPLCSLMEDRVEILTVLVGPEGGWTEDEVEAADANGYRGVNLGRRILRIETAAVLIAAIHSY